MESKEHIVVKEDSLECTGQRKYERWHCVGALQHTVFGIIFLHTIRSFLSAGMTVWTLAHETLGQIELNVLAHLILGDSSQFRNIV